MDACKPQARFLLASIMNSRGSSEAAATTTTTTRMSAMTRTPQRETEVRLPRGNDIQKGRERKLFALFSHYCICLSLHFFAPVRQVRNKVSVPYRDAQSLTGRHGGANQEDNG